MRANIIGPLCSTTSKRACIAACPFFGIVLRLRQLGDVERGVAHVIRFLPGNTFPTTRALKLVVCGEGDRIGNLAQQRRQDFLLPDTPVLRVIRKAPRLGRGAPETLPGLAALIDPDRSIPTSRASKKPPLCQRAAPALPDHGAARGLITSVKKPPVSGRGFLSHVVLPPIAATMIKCRRARLRCQIAGPFESGAG
jgi:hypothetical protein